LLVFGKIAGEEAAACARAASRGQTDEAERIAAAQATRLHAMLNVEAGARPAAIRDAMTDSMESGVGIYREERALRATCERLADLRTRCRRGILLQDRSRAFNTEWLSAIELVAMLEVAEAMAHSALARRESRGAHMRLDGFETRDDVNFLKHSHALYQGDGPPRIEHAPVTITRSPPRARVYGGEGKQAQL
jgi:fumarate reductase flavoprotein subunit